MDQLSQFSDLSVVEKLQLVEGLWDQIAASTETLPIPPWQKEELEKRRKNYQANPDSGIPWDEAKQRFRQAHD
jgi:putative addiction module component (TIGR02574 family)